MKKSKEENMNKNSNDKEKKNMEEVRFIRAYSKALADALLANEERQRRRRQRRRRGGGSGRCQDKKAAAYDDDDDDDDDDDENYLAARAYSSLCHDEPMITRGGDDACRLLAERLLAGFLLADNGGGGGGGEKRHVGMESSRTNDEADVADASGSITMTEMTRRRGGARTGVGVGVGVGVSEAAAPEPRGGAQLRSRKGGAAAAVPTPTPTPTPILTPPAPKTTARAKAKTDTTTLTQTRFGLSDRFVSGILHATGRVVSAAPSSSSFSSSSPSPSVPTAGNETKLHSSSFYGNVDGEGCNLSSHATSEGYALLYYAAFVRGPLLCLGSSEATPALSYSSAVAAAADANKGSMNDKLSAIRTFLGSYSGHVQAGKNGDNNRKRQQQRRRRRDRRGHGIKDDVNDKDANADARVRRLLESMKEMNTIEAQSKAGSSFNSSVGNTMGKRGDEAGYDKKTLIKTDAEDAPKRQCRQQRQGSDSSFSSSSPLPSKSDKDKDNGNHNHDSLEEIFADESDPDDYEYDSSRYNNVSPSCYSTHAAADATFGPTITTKGKNDATFGKTSSFDPIHSCNYTSEPLTTKECKRRIDCLLSEISYTRMAALSPKTWEGWNVSQTLVDLAMLLLRAELGAFYESRLCSKEVGTSFLEFCNGVVDDDDVEGGGGGGGGDDDDSDDDDSGTIPRLSSRWYLPLTVLRDRALDERDGTRNDALASYLGIVKELLSCSNNLGRCMSTPTTSTGGMTVSWTKSIVALAALSSLCGPDGFGSRVGGVGKEYRAVAREKVRGAIVDVLDDLADIVEAALPNRRGEGAWMLASMSASALASASRSGVEEGMKEGGEDDDDSQSTPPWVNVVAHLLPVLQILTGVRFSDLSPVDDDGGGGGVGSGGRTNQAGFTAGGGLLSPKEAQSLLSSGLFRNLVLLYEGTGPCLSSTTTSPPPPPPLSSSSPSFTSPATSTRTPSTSLAAANYAMRTLLLRSILVLSAQSPSTLGRYATRVPELASAVHSDVFWRGRDMADGTLWTGLCASVALGGKVGGVGGGGSNTVLRLRNKPALPTADESRHACRGSFAVLCREVCSFLERELRPGNAREGGGGRNVDGEGDGVEFHLDPLAQFVRLCNGVETLPSLGAAWVSAALEGEGGGGGGNGGSEKDEDPRMAISMVRAALATVSTRHGGRGAVDSTKRSRSKGDDEDDRKPEHLPFAQGNGMGMDRGRWSDEEVVAARRGVKILSLLLESSSVGQPGAGIDKIDIGKHISLSSKAD